MRQLVPTRQGHARAQDHGSKRNARAAVKEYAMPNQEESKDGMPRKDKDRATPDVEKYSTDGQSGARGNTGEQREPDLVPPSGVNERDHGAAEDKPMGGGSVNLDDDDITHPRGKTTGTGGTWNSKGGDSAPLGPPREILSDRNGPSDPDNRKK
jgi:hypothetical protein